MPNVLLTQRCVRACPYCFATRHMEQSPPGDVLTWENLIYIADFFQSDGDSSLSLLGGEPLLHPHIADFIVYLEARGIAVTVFTSGICSEAALTRIVGAVGREGSNATFVVNLNNPADTPPGERRAIGRFMTAFGRRCVLSVNVFKRRFDYSYAVEAVNRYGLQRTLRLGLAHPVPGLPNSCMLPAELPAMAEELVAALPMFEAHGIRPMFDCGFPLCAFTDAQLGRLYRAGADLSFSCEPAVDIGPDLQVWRCFPLASYDRRSLLEFNSRAELLEYFRRYEYDLRVETAGLYAECDACVHRRRGMCAGGCLSHILGDFAGEEHIRPEKFYPENERHERE